VNQAEESQAGQGIACRGCGRTLRVPSPAKANGAAEAPSVVKFRCPACGRKFAIKASLAGQKIRCSGCGAGVRVPSEEGSAVTPAVAAESPPALVKFRCPTCQQVSEARAELAGEKVQCSGCGAGIRVPAAKGAPAQSPRPALKTFGAADGATTTAAPGRPKADGGAGGLSYALEELASIEGVEAPRRAGKVLPSRSETMEQVRQQATASAVAEDDQPEKKKKKKKKKKRKKTGSSDAKDTLVLVAGVGVVVGALALVAWRVPDLRFPLGGLLCVVGFVVYLLGAAAIRQLVAEEGGFQVLLFRFFPPYQLWFVVRNWADTKDFVAFFAAGLVIMALGGGVIKTSAVGKRAAAADRAIEKARQSTEAEAPSAGTIDGPAEGE
jgi:DNA-directed RNA polymerase subunit RPC12/RpoP